jgi:hypothetical protein
LLALHYPLNRRGRRQRRGGVASGPPNILLWCRRRACRPR